MKQVIKPSETPVDWSAEALYNKACRYSEKMNAHASDTWEHALWSGLCLELLARAALANLSPALLAEPKKISNIVHALGFPVTESKFSPTSIGTQMVLEHLGNLLPGFDTEMKSFCSTHVGRRNSELHSGDAPYDTFTGVSWHGAYFKACLTLLESMGYDLSDFIGPEQTDAAEQEIAAAADQAAKAITGDVKAHKQVWEAKDDQERMKLANLAELSADRALGHRVRCPACDSRALVGGQAVGEAHKELEGDLIIEKQEHLPHWFMCTACGLKISGLSKLQVVGLGERYVNTETYEAAEYYASAPEYADYQDDNNEPF